MKITTIIASFTTCLAVHLLTSHAANAKNVDAPTGWSDKQQGDKRTLVKNGITIEIGPWQSTRGKSTRDWLKSQERITSGGGTFVSSQGVKAEPKVADSFALIRNIRVKGQNQVSVLYACPGKAGTVRLMELRGVVSRQNARDVKRASDFGERICLSDPKMASYVSSSDRTATADRQSGGKRTMPRDTGSLQSLAAANAEIPAGNRPRSARIILDQKWVGFPAVMVNEANAEMSFANGYSTTCAKWNLLTQSPTPRSTAGIKRCKVKRGASEGKPARKFSPGQTIDISFGRTSGSSRNLGSSSSSISGGTLRMTKDGRIQIGKFNAFSIKSGRSGAGGGNRKISLSGRYYLNGHTITIKDDLGQIYHGFIAASSNKGSAKIDHVFINGEHYWNRKK